ncbi:MAG TPA: HAMP domain-containing sensor histidine kinase [Bacteroidales bacterium]|nr:HAMP domain-containing sensor histidine kinase [Bacteroidales bacterium]
MNKTLHKLNRRSILIRIFTVIVAFSLSLILFILAFWAIFLNQPNPVYAHIHLAITLVILVTVGSFVVSFLIRKILKPLSIIREGVENAGKGDFNQKITLKSQDEFGVLADAYNKMTEDLKKMIQSREQLLSDVSHELRTPITRARLALEMMQDSAYKESILGDLKEMEIMITDILESERLRNGSHAALIKPENLSELLKKVVDYYKGNKRLVVFPVDSQIMIQADSSLMMTVFRNIIDNSFKYSHEPDPVEVSVIRADQYVTIKIEDNGIGVPEEKLSFIFEPFFRVDQSRSRATGGYGLGLHLCKKIMDLNKAEIKVENKKNGPGLIVQLIFPA